jgi:hypothetical protein
MPFITFLNKVTQVRNLKKIKQEIKDSSGRGNESKLLMDISQKFYSDCKALTILNTLKFIWTKELKTLSKRYIKKAYEKFHNLIKSIYLNESTYLKRMSDFRNIVKSNYDNYKVDNLIHFKVDNIIFNNRKKEYELKVEQTSSVRGDNIQYTSSQVFNIIDHCLGSLDPYKRVIAVQLLTASRFIEAMKVSDFYKGSDIKKIKIQGIAKNDTSRVFERPLIYTTSISVLNSIKLIRSKFSIKDLTNENITSKYLTILNSKIKQLFKNKNTTSHTLRHISTNMSFQMYADKIPENVYLRTLLLHDNASSSNAYQKIWVEFDQPIDIKYDYTNVNYNDGSFIMDPSLMNSRYLSDTEKFKRLDQIVLRFGKFPRIKDFKYHGYGSKTIQKFKILTHQKNK